MSRICTVCGYSESRVLAEARVLGLTEEFYKGLYTCCQIAQWANEQFVAWVEAADEDRARANGTNGEADWLTHEPAVVPLRKRRRDHPR